MHCSANHICERGAPRHSQITSRRPGISLAPALTASFSPLLRGVSSEHDRLTEHLRRLDLTPWKLVLCFFGRTYERPPASRRRTRGLTEAKRFAHIARKALRRGACSGGGVQLSSCARAKPRADQTIFMHAAFIVARVSHVRKNRRPAMTFPISCRGGGQACEASAGSWLVSRRGRLPSYALVICACKAEARLGIYVPILPSTRPPSGALRKPPLLP